jgi:hypothetical protein
MISGQLPSEHGVHTHSQSFDSLPEEETLFHSLDGYRTVGISANIYAGSAYDFDRYFDRWVPLRRGLPFPDSLDSRSFSSPHDGSFKNHLLYAKRCLSTAHPVKSLCNGALDVFRSKVASEVTKRLFDRGAKSGLRVAERELQNGDGPAFVFLNLMEAHIPYRPAFYLRSEFYDCPWSWSSANKSVWELNAEEYDERYWNRRNQLYRASIDYLDRRVADFLSRISDDTTVIVTSDHGDNLGTGVDEGLANHKSSLSEGVLHVPFCICNAPTGADRTDSRYFSHLEIPDLVEEIRNGHVGTSSSDPVPAAVVGMSSGPDPEANHEYWDRMIRCSYRNSEKVVWDSLGNITRYLLDERKSNWQYQIDEPSRVPEWAKSTFEEDIVTAKQKAKESTDAVDIDGSTKDRLGELGYL